MLLVTYAIEHSRTRVAPGALILYAGDRANGAGLKTYHDRNIAIEINDLFQKAYDFMETSDKNVFITGKAGTGKSTLLDYFRENSAKKVVILAPTGVAAVNVKGQTIHSFFRFRPDVTLSKIEKVRSTNKKGDPGSIYKKLDTIVIDEISMVRSDLLDCIDKFLRLNGRDNTLPFGGVQMVFIGDLYQLPPVVVGQERQIFKENYRSEYFFDAKVFETGNDSLFGAQFDMELIELEKNYRQKGDQKFLDILNTIRNNTASDEELSELNTRYKPSFEQGMKDYYVYLTTTNKLAASINEQRLAKIKGDTFNFTGSVDGTFDSKYLTTDLDLQLKIGAQVMLVNNDHIGGWVNGNIGKIVDIEADRDIEDRIVEVKLANGKTVFVTPYTWEVYNFKFDTGANSLVAETVGSFTQYPLKLAWAMTIHKSQGKTFDKVVIDIGSGTFAHGQMYVALSRCTSLEGIVLKQKIEKRHIRMDWKVVDFITKYQYQLAERDLPLSEKIQMLNDAIEHDQALEITYLKSSDVKTRRKIQPQEIADMEFQGVEFLGLRAYCLTRDDLRTFRVDRILEIKTTEDRAEVLKV